jgi:hypothetical protein
VNGTVGKSAKPGKPVGSPKTGGGSRKGIPNKATAEFRDTVRKLLEDNAANVGLWLSQVATGNGIGDPDPAKALDLLVKLAEFAAPKLSRAEVTGKDGEPVQQRVVVEFVKPGGDA